MNLKPEMSSTNNGTNYCNEEKCARFLIIYDFEFSHAIANFTSPENNFS